MKEIFYCCFSNVLTHFFVTRSPILRINLVRGFNHERDILGLKSIFVKNYGSRPFGDPQEHGNEAR